MAKTYTDWAQEIIRKVGTVGAGKLIKALEEERAKVCSEITEIEQAKLEDIAITEK